MLDIGQTKLVIDFIEEHLPEKLDLFRIARETHVSPFHLHRSFSQILGLTIHDYLRRRRLTEAARMLMFTDTPIIEIALSAGYESQQAFTRIFKAIYKYPPNAFRNGQVFYPLQLRFDVGECDRLLGENGRAAAWKARFAREDDIPQWMRLVRLVVDGYPVLDEEEYVRILRTAIDRNQALIVKDGGIALGIILFSPSNGRIDFLGIHPLFRHRGIAKLLLDEVVAAFPRGNHEISITTYRAGDMADTGYRKTIQSLGFIEAEHLVEFGYPTQKFLLNTASLQNDN
ncbi:MAG TPA: GNAT family N-acetyltransferase [Candidatus Ozemobacteraceae bacterium]|nr:GNAT family N-acetyltransferase [Candidatus Ozemobacteraceae bacterium]